MKTKKFLMVFITLLVTFCIVSQMSEVKADLETSVEVSGTLYSSNIKPVDHVNPDMNPKIIRSIKNETKISGVLGDLGDSSSNLISLCGVMLVLSGIGLVIERLI